MKRIILASLLVATGLFASDITIHDTKDMLVENCLKWKNSKQVCECAEELTHRAYNLYEITTNLNYKNEHLSGYNSGLIDDYNNEIKKNINMCKKSENKIPKDTRELNKVELEKNLKQILSFSFAKNGMPDDIRDSVIHCMIKIKMPYEYAITYSPDLHTTWHLSALLSKKAIQNKFTKDEVSQMNKFYEVVKYVANDNATLQLCIAGTPAK